jgi:phenylalanine-4-hydroxylase
MGRKSSVVYASHLPDAAGRVHYAAAEHAVWQHLVVAHRAAIQWRACDAYLRGLRELRLSPLCIPQTSDVSERLAGMTGWRLEPVPALIDIDRFWRLLSERRFPCATFIRNPSELEYLEEPDIFHEIVGHCPMLADLRIAALAQRFGEWGAGSPRPFQIALARLYWFTVEFGLVSTPDGVRAWGGGILSSPAEVRHCLGATPLRQPFDLLTVLRTPYRIDILQPRYFVVDSLDGLRSMLDDSLPAMITLASRLGLYDRTYLDESGIHAGQEDSNGSHRQ